MNILIYIFIFLTSFYSSSASAQNEFNYLDKPVLKVLEACQRYYAKGLSPDDSLRTVANYHSVFAMKDDGTFVLNNNANLIGQRFWNATNVENKYFVQDIIKIAKKLDPGKIGSYEYLWRNMGDKPRNKIVRFVYFKPWNLVIIKGEYIELLK